MSFASRLLRWHRAHGRHDLPWQQPRTPYRVWISEIMLQQTTVRAVIPYFERFIARFPDVTTLAAASPDEVLAHWSGLGYYARARNLHAAARQLVRDHAGDLPQQIDELLALPGIGRSTAGAILAQAHGQRHPILDGNVKRVLARHAGVEGWPGRSAVLRELWALSEARTPVREVAAYTQAIMDLGATLCRRHQPLCGDCPVAGDCVARIESRQAELPGRAPRKGPRRRRETRMLIAVDGGGRVLLQRRPPAGIWGGLWSLPELDATADLVAECRQRYGLEVAESTLLPAIEHAFSHFDLRIQPVRVRVESAAVMDAPDQAWYKASESTALGTPAPVSRLLAEMDK